MKSGNHWIQKSGLFLLLLLTVGGWQATYSQTVTVWPGDANDNGVVNHVDLLYLGIHFGLQGPGRASISINWTGHQADKWLTPIPNRVDPAHADCNGDSTVDAIDVLAIETNYGLDNGWVLPDSSSLSNVLTNPPLGFALPSSPLLAGTQDTIPFTLGSAGIPVDSLLGFSATLTYDTSLVDTAYVYFGDSWLGTPGVDLLTLESYSPGALEVAATRTDRTDVLNKRGGIGGVVVVMDDNLKTHATAASLNLGFSQALCLTSFRNVVRIVPNADTIPILPGTAQIGAIMYPVPVTQQLNIVLLEAQEGIVSGRLLDGLGREVKAFQFDGLQYVFQRENLINGIYFIELTTDTAILRRKICLID